VCVQVVQHACVCVMSQQLSPPKPYPLKLLNLRIKPSASVCRTKRAKASKQIHFPLQKYVSVLFS
jgi:hypothetical protein